MAANQISSKSRFTTCVSYEPYISSLPFTVHMTYRTNAIRKPRADGSDGTPRSAARSARCDAVLACDPAIEKWCLECSFSPLLFRTKGPRVLLKGLALLRS